MLMDPRNHASPRGLNWLEGPGLARLVHRSILEEPILDRLRAKMLAVFGILLATVGPLVASGYFRKGEHLYGGAFLFCTALGLGTFLSIRFVGSTRLSSHLGSLAMWIAAMTGTYALGGTSSIAARWFAVIPVLAAVFGGGRLGLRWFAISWLTFTTLTFAPEFGIQMPSASEVGADRIHQVVTMTTFMVIVGGLFGISEMLRIWLVRERETMRALERTKEKLVQSEKMASLGLLASGIAHEIKNPLNFVNNFSELGLEFIAEHHSENPDPRPSESAAEAVLLMVEGNLERIHEHGVRANRIINSMLLHAREGHGDRSEVAINRLVHEQVELAYEGFCSRIHGFTAELDESLDPLAGEIVLPDQEFSGLVINLVTNACQSMRSRSISGARGYRARLVVSTRRENETLVIAIGDNGVGIPAEERRRIFDPFFTTKAPGEGTGLGLSLAYGLIVTELGGSIDVVSEPSEGANFVIRIPLESEG